MKKTMKYESVNVDSRLFFREIEDVDRGVRRASILVS